MAHINWTLSPFTIKVDYFQLFYAFILGVIQGVAYQKSRSIVYLALMHSVSNFFTIGLAISKYLMITKEAETMVSALDSLCYFFRF